MKDRYKVRLVIPQVCLMKEEGKKNTTEEKNKAGKLDF